MHHTSTHDTHRPTLRVNRDQFLAATGADTVAALALQIGVDRSTVHRVLSGTTTASGQFIAAAIAHTGATFEQLFEVVDA